jgi:FkbH-like protein
LNPCKCVVWDLDGTVWEGVLLEGGAKNLRPGMLDAIRGLDERGILQAIASRNEHADAMARLDALGLAGYFLYPQIHWGSKVGSIQAIAKALNIGLDSFAFIDDQAFERAEVIHHLPEVRCYDADVVPSLLSLPELMPPFITEESAQRRHMYRADAVRNTEEADFGGSSEEFLATLNMRFSIRQAALDDLQRAEELTVRTNQLNSTGLPFSYDELAALVEDPSALLWVASLQDRLGSYGTIGLCLVDKKAELWTIRLLLMSCRVMSRGVGTLLLHHAMRAARAAGVALQADFRHTGRNRQMFITYKFGGFRAAGPSNEAGQIKLVGDLSNIPPAPHYVGVFAPPSTDR